MVIFRSHTQYASVLIEKAQDTDITVTYTDLDNYRKSIVFSAALYSISITDALPYCDINIIGNIKKIDFTTSSQSDIYYVKLINTDIEYFLDYNKLEYIYGLEKNNNITKLFERGRLPLLKHCKLPDIQTFNAEIIGGENENSELELIIPNSVTYCNAPMRNSKLKSLIFGHGCNDISINQQAGYFLYGSKIGKVVIPNNIESYSVIRGATIEELYIYTPKIVIPKYNSIDYLYVDIIDNATLSQYDPLCGENGGYMNYKCIEIGEGTINIPPFVLSTWGARPSQSLRVIIGNNVKSISSKAFVNGGDGLYFIMKCAIPPSINPDSFQGLSSGCTIYVPNESVDSYKTYTNWSALASKIKPLSELPS